MSEVTKIATRVSYGNALVELAKEHDDVYVLDADLAAATQTAIFKKEFPSLELLFKMRNVTFGCSSRKDSIACKRQQCRAVSVALMVMLPSSRERRLVIFCSPLKNCAHPAETYS